MAISNADLKKSLNKRNDEFSKLSKPFPAAKKQNRFFTDSLSSSDAKVKSRAKRR